MEFLPGVSKQDLGYLVPDFEYGEFCKHLGLYILYLLIVLDTFLNEHHNLLMVVIDIVVFEYLAFSIVTQHFQELLTFASQLFVNLLHD